MFFLDYIACGKNYPEKIAQIVAGVAEGCKQSEAALIGGETAEHPGLMPEDEYDLAGFAVGVVDRKDMITGESICAGDTLIGMHLRPVAVPFRGEIRQIGHANLVCAYSRLPYVGGERAVYAGQA